MEDIACRAADAARELAFASTEQKNSVLEFLALLLRDRQNDIISANEADMEEARKNNLPANMVDRLKFGKKKILSRQKSLARISALPDPVGSEIVRYRTENGLDVSRVRVPLGVILMIYEARPHVTVNAGAFCVKAGNAAILRGGSEAKRCNTLLGELWEESLLESGLPRKSVEVITSSHEEVEELLAMNEHISLVIPRGGKKLIETVSAGSRIPVLKHFQGICHVYLDKDCDAAQGIGVILDSKCLMPEVCNAAETLLVHESLESRLPEIVKSLQNHGVAVRGCERTRKTVPDAAPADEQDWRTEYLDMILSVRTVDSLDQAIHHINTYGSHHTDSIVASDPERASRFTDEVDSAVTLVNASTMFCDGASLGMGAEIGISTDKIHARGPMGLEELTSYKFVIRGEGHIMGEFPDSRETA